MNNRSILLIAFILGIITLLLGITLAMTYPYKMAQMPDGFFSPITAFEFIQTDTEVLQLFGEPGTSQNEWITAINTGNTIDYIFIIFYCSFMASLTWYFIKKTAHKWLYVFLLTIVIIALSDVIENIQLSKITNNLNLTTFKEPLGYLFTFTWLKWGSLALLLSGLALYTVKTGWLGKIFTVTSFTTLILGVSAFFNRSVITSYFTLGIFIEFLLLTIITFALLNKEKSNN
jgi:hypothetical protein